MSVEPNSRQSRPVRVVVADDDPLVRTAVRRAVNGDSRIRVEGEATNAHQAMDLIRRLRPDVILLDSDLPGPDLVSITRRIHGVAPDVGVVVFASGSDDEQALLGLRAGAVGILGKGVPMEALARSLIAVKRGEAPIPRRLSAALMRRVRETPAIGPRPPTGAQRAHRARMAGDGSDVRRPQHDGDRRPARGVGRDGAQPHEKRLSQVRCPFPRGSGRCVPAPARLRSLTNGFLPDGSG